MHAKCTIHLGHMLLRAQGHMLVTTVTRLLELIQCLSMCTHENTSINTNSWQFPLHYFCSTVWGVSQGKLLGFPCLSLFPASEASSLCYHDYCWTNLCWRQNPASLAFLRRRKTNGSPGILQAFSARLGGLEHGSHPCTDRRTLLDYSVLSLASLVNPCTEKHIHSDSCPSREHGLI